MEMLKKMKDPRLYIALYAIDGALRPCDPIGSQDYSWTFLVAPENATTKDHGLRYRITQYEGWRKRPCGTHSELDMALWEPDRCAVPLGRHDDIVARVLIAKVADRKKLDQYLGFVMPEMTIHVKPSGQRRTSKEWVERAHEQLDEPARGTLSGTRYYIMGKLEDWKTIESCCAGFAEKVKKRPQTDTVPTFDLLENREVFQ